MESGDTIEVHMEQFGGYLLYHERDATPGPVAAPQSTIGELPTTSTPRLEITFDNLDGHSLIIKTRCTTLTRKAMDVNRDRMQVSR
jgi:hypothetical protein